MTNLRDQENGDDEDHEAKESSGNYQVKLQSGAFTLWCVGGASQWSEGGDGSERRRARDFIFV